MPYVPVKFQTANQKRRNRGKTNIPYKYMTTGQKSRNGGDVREAIDVSPIESHIDEKAIGGIKIVERQNFFFLLLLCLCYLR